MTAFKNPDEVNESYKEQVHFINYFKHAAEGKVYVVECHFEKVGQSYDNYEHKLILTLSPLKMHGKVNAKEMEFINALAEIFSVTPELDDRANLEKFIFRIPTITLCERLKFKNDDRSTLTINDDHPKRAIVEGHHLNLTSTDPAVRFLVSFLVGAVSLGGYFIYQLIRTGISRAYGNLSIADVKEPASASKISSEADLLRYETKHLNYWSHFCVNYERGLYLTPQVEEKDTREIYVPAKLNKL